MFPAFEAVREELNVILFRNDFWPKGWKFFNHLAVWRE